MLLTITYMLNLNYKVVYSSSSTVVSFAMPVILYFLCVNWLFPLFILFSQALVVIYIIHNIVLGSSSHSILDISGYLWLLYVYDLQRSKFIIVPRLLTQLCAVCLHSARPLTPLQKFLHHQWNLYLFPQLFDRFLFRIVVSCSVSPSSMNYYCSVLHARFIIMGFAVFHQRYCLMTSVPKLCSVLTVLTWL